MPGSSGPSLGTEPCSGARRPGSAIVFDDDVRLASGIKAIRNGGGSVLDGKPHVVGGRSLVIPLRSGLADGDYTVLWRVLSDDGHKLSGVVAFGVGAGRAPPQAALSADNGPSVQDVVSRLLFFAGLLTAVGAAFFRFAVGPVPVRLMLGAFLLVFVGVSGAVHDVSLATRFGTVMAVAAVISGLGAVLAAVAPVFPRLEPLPFLAAFALLPLPTLAGHSLDPGRPLLAPVVDFLHVAAASFWLGGLVALAIALTASVARAPMVRRFSNVALVSVVVLSVTGVIRAIEELRSLEQLWSTGYGQLLIVKTALLAALVVLGWLNRYRLVPKLSFDALRRNVAVELMLFTGLIAAVALLTDLRPGRDRVAAAVVATPKGPPPVVQARESGDLAVALALRPAGAEVHVLGPDGGPVDGLAVKIAGVATRSCGEGCYGVSLLAGRPGEGVRGRPRARVSRSCKPSAGGRTRDRCDSRVPQPAERRLRGAAGLEPQEQGRRRVHARASESPRVPNSRRGRRDHHRRAALGSRTGRQVGAVAPGSVAATGADLGGPRHERVPARDDADDIRRVVRQADRPGVVHVTSRPPHVAAAEPAHDRSRAFHDASLHGVQRGSANPCAVPLNVPVPGTGT